MINTWLSVVMLCLEASAVVRLRMLKMSAGGAGAYDEAQLMFAEKIGAGIETFAGIGRETPGSVIERYRGHVAANALRLGGT